MKAPLQIAAPLWLAVALAGCAPHAAIVDLDEDKVLVEASGDDMSLVRKEAARGCAINGRTAVPLSSWCLDAVCSRAHYLFGCRE